MVVTNDLSKAIYVESQSKAGVHTIPNDTAMTLNIGMIKYRLVNGYHPSPLAVSLAHPWTSP